MSHFISKISPFKGHFYDTGIGSVIPAATGAALGGFLGPAGVIAGGAAGGALRASSRDASLASGLFKGGALGLGLVGGATALGGSGLGSLGGAAAGDAALSSPADAGALASGGTSGAIASGGTAAGDEALFSGLNFGSLAGSDAVPIGAGGGDLTSYIGSGAASGYGGGAADLGYIMPGADAAAGGATGGIGGGGAGGGGGALSWLRGGQNGILGSGISPLQAGIGGASSLYALMAAQQLKQQGQQLADQSDPFSSYRAGYGNQLLGFMGNPDSIENDPAYQGSVQATRRAMAKGGYTASGNEMEALKKNYGDYYNMKVAQLAGLAGANRPSGGGLALAGSTAGTQLTGNALANLGYMAALAKA